MDETRQTDGSREAVAAHPSTSIPVHAATVQVSPSIPSDVAVGTDIDFKIQVACRAGCDLTDQPVTVMAPHGIVTTSPLLTFNDKVNETALVTVKAPDDVGEHAWRIVFPGSEADGCIHEESSLPILFRTKPHLASIAVWDVPSPVVVNSSFALKVGIKCSVGCQMTDHRVEITDDLGRPAGQARLADSPWPGTESLYWTTVDLPAPSSEGVYFWSTGLVAGESGLAHEAAGVRFSCRAANPPEHALTIQVTARTTGLPVDDVEVRVGPYQGFTDQGGIATIELPGGTYGLSIRKDGYTAEPTMLAVSESQTISIDAVDIPTKELTEAPVGPEHPYRD